MRVGSAIWATMIPGFVIAVLPLFAYAQLSVPSNRITEQVNESRMAMLRGNVHPFAITSPSQTLPVSLPMEHMILQLKSDAPQEAALEQLIAEQQDSKSPLYHHFLTPQQFGQQFGVSTPDLDKITSWLSSRGFTVEEIAANHRAIVFSGTSDQVASAFKTEIRSFSSGGVTHYANATDPQIPLALSQVVGGVVKLHNVRHQASISQVKTVSQGLRQAQYTGSSGHYLSPADYATIYNLNPLTKNGITGAGQSIAILARSNISLQDVQSFRQTFGLPAKDPSFVMVNSDPGVLQGDSTETTLDTEWSGAVAPGALVKVVMAASTNTADGIDLSAQYAVNNNVAPVISLSYGSCEAYMGAAEMAFYNALWQQAAAQGISVFVASGDSGAAGCNGGSQTSGGMRAVNGLCSSPYSTCVGGTEFTEGTNPGQYWLAGNNPSYGSATSYIPESVWNESGANGGSGLWAGGGGVSTYYAKPSWQSVVGVPADGHRDVPDVSLTAAGHDGYIVVQSGYLMAVSGTSAAAPSFAGMMALVDQNTNARQGNANVALYGLFSNQTSGGAPIFHDITTGSNSVPGVTGFAATAGYDLATGLGSVDANQLVTHWAGAASGAVPSLSLSSSSSTLSIAIGQSGQSVITSTANAAFKSSVALSVSGAPSGVTAALGSATIVSPGSGSVSLTLSIAKTAAPGTYPINVTGKGGSQTANVTVTLTIPKPTFILAVDSSSIKLVSGQASAKATITATPQNGFNSALAVSISGLPPGVTAALAQTTLNSQNPSSDAITFAASASAHAGTYPVTLTAVGGNVTQLLALSISISAPVTCTLAASPSSMRLTAGQSSALQVGCSAVQGTFAGPLSLSLTGLPSGVRAAFAQTSISAGSFTVVSFNSDVTAAPGNYNLSITASATNFTQSVVVPLTVAVPNVFTLAAAQNTLSVKAGTTGTLSLAAKHLGSFNSALKLSVSGLPAGVTAGMSPATFAAPGDGSTVLTITALASAAAGSYQVIVTGAGGGQTVSVPVTLTVTAAAGFSMNLSTNALSVTQGGQPGIVTITTSNYSGGFNSTITLSFTNLGPGMNYGFSSGSADAKGVHTSIGIWASASTPTGVYPVKLTVSGGGIVYTQIISVTVGPAAASKP